jgi:hypothetical protein
MLAMHQNGSGAATKNVLAKQALNKQCLAFINGVLPFEKI